MEGFLRAVKCPNCGFVSYAGLDQCKKCNYPFVKSTEKGSSAFLTSLFPGGVRAATSPVGRRGGGGGSKRRLLIRCSSLMQGPQTATDRVTGGDRTENSPHSWPPNRETQSWNSKRVNQMCALTIQSKQPVTIPERRQVKRRPLPQDGCTERNT